MIPNAEYGIVTRELTADDIKTAIASQYKGEVELSTEDITARVVSIVKYEEEI